MNDDATTQTPQDRAQDETTTSPAQSLATPEKAPHNSLQSADAEPVTTEPTQLTDIPITEGLPRLPEYRNPESDEGDEDPFSPLSARERQIALGITLVRQGKSMAEAARAAGLPRTSLIYAYRRSEAQFQAPTEDRKTTLAAMDDRILKAHYALTEMGAQLVAEEAASGRITGKDAVVMYAAAAKALGEQRGYRWREPTNEGGMFQDVWDHVARMEDEFTMELKITKGAASKSTQSRAIDVTPSRQPLPYDDD